MTIFNKPSSSARSRVRIFLKACNAAALPPDSTPGRIKRREIGVETDMPRGHSDGNAMSIIETAQRQYEHAAWQADAPGRARGKTK
ncbi:hypothetical protein [Burkholderia thailandensis]|uniref:hypothetical protein n=1 Tax=Burkholderia thailandensis TaxID=57975 RepID=UPI0012DA5CE7|nr:hypothetical protein [Burkholderia thailandensis]